MNKECSKIGLLDVDCLGKPVDDKFRWAIGSILHRYHVPYSESMFVVCFGSQDRCHLLGSRGQQAANGLVSQLHGSALTVRNAAEEPMLIHVGSLDFLSKGSVAWYSQMIP